MGSLCDQVSAVAVNLMPQLLKNLDNIESYITEKRCQAVDLVNNVVKFVECPFGNAKIYPCTSNYCSVPVKITGTHLKHKNQSSDDDSDFLPDLHTPPKPSTPKKAKQTVTFKTPISEVKGIDSIGIQFSLN